MSARTGSPFSNLNEDSQGRKVVNIHVEEGSSPHPRKHHFNHAESPDAANKYQHSRNNSRQLPPEHPNSHPPDSHAVRINPSSRHPSHPSNVSVDQSPQVSARNNVNSRSRSTNAAPRASMAMQLHDSPSPPPTQQTLSVELTQPRPSVTQLSSPQPRPSVMQPPSTTQPTAPPPQLEQHPSLQRTSSLVDKKGLADMGLKPQMIDRLASVDPRVIASVQKAREAAKPDITKAERYRNLTCPRVRNTTNGSYSLYNIWKFTDREFLQYGLGVMLWYKLVRRMIYLFIVMFLLNLPSLVLNIHGPDTTDTISTATPIASNRTTDPTQFAVDRTYGLSYTTISHQGLVLNATIMGYSKQEVGLLVGGLDTLSILVYLCALVWIFRDHRQESTSYNSTVMTVRRFTVLVTNLPDTKPILTRLDIAEFFQKKFGQVVDVSIAYNDMHLIELFKQRGEMKKEIQSLEVQDHIAERDQLQAKLNRFDQTILFQRKQFTKQIRAAFVTFQEQESVTKCLTAYPSSWWSTIFMPESLKIHGVAPKISRAAEPSNTLFHNLGLSWGDQCCRRTWTGIVSLAIMSFSFVAVFVSQYYQNRISTTDCTFIQVPTKAEATTDTTKFCYCAALSTSDLYSESSFCSNYITQFALAKGLIFMTAFATVVVNFLLQIFMNRLSIWERHSSVTSQQRGVTSRLFWGLFFNTAIIILIVNANFAPYLGDNFASKLKWLFPGSYSEFKPEWFYDVGVSILLTMFLNALNPHLLSLIAIPYDSYRRRKCASRKKNQNELNELYQGRKFFLFERYSVLINTVFVCMMFASGMPLLWLVGAVTFTLTYWFDKTTFLRNYRIPPRYDETMDLYAEHMLPFAVVPHIALGLWFYTSPMTDSFLLGNEVPGINTDSSIGPIRSDGIFSFQQRFLQWNTFPMFALFLLLASGFIVRRVLSFVFFCRASEAEQRALTLGQEEKRSRSRMVTYQEACAKIGLESYRLSKQHEYRSAFIATESKRQLPMEVDLDQLRAGAGSNPAENRRGSQLADPALLAKYQIKKPIQGVGGATGTTNSTGPPRGASNAVAPMPATPPPPSWHPTPTPAWSSASGPVGTSETKLTPGSTSGSNRGAGGDDHHQQQPSGDSGTVSANLQEMKTPTPPPAQELDLSGPDDFDPSFTETAIVNSNPVASQDLGAAPIAISDQMSDEAVVTMAAAVTESNQSNGANLIPISCPSCTNLFQIVDCGEAMSYTCPFCGTATVI